MEQDVRDKFIAIEKVQSNMSADMKTGFGDIKEMLKQQHNENREEHKSMFCKIDEMKDKNSAQDSILTKHTTEISHIQAIEKRRAGVIYTLTAGLIITAIKAIWDWMKKGI